MRVLVAYVTAGAGHRRAAEAIAQAVSAQYPQAHVRCLDVLHDAPGWFRTGYAWSYLFLVRHAPWVWKWSYRFTDVAAIYRWIQPLRRWWNLVIVRRFIRRLKLMQPEVVITTHFLPADVCSAAKRAGWWRGLLIVVVTDFYPHQFWISREPEAMVVSVSESATVLRQRGIDGSRIHVLGIPVAGTLGQPADRSALQQRFQLDCQRATVLITSGSTTVGQFERVVDCVLALEAALPNQMQLLVVCGEDEAAKTRLMSRAQMSAMPMRVFGFVDYMADLMAVSDLIVSKAGGLTVSEALARGAPLVLYHVIPGQEQMNAQYVERHGAALIARHPEDVARVVRRFLEEPAHAEAMRQAVRVLSRPDAARAIVTQVVQPLLNRQEAA